jgi:hypothetical protein
MRRGSALRAYLKRWKVEFSVLLDAAGPDSSEREIRAAASGHLASKYFQPANGTGATGAVARVRDGEDGCTGGVCRRSGHCGAQRSR